MSQYQNPDKRKPCGRTTIEPIVWLNSSGSRCHESHKPSGSYKIYQNVTRVPSITYGDATPIPPYARPEEDSAPNCGDWYLYDCNDGTPEQSGQFYCGVPTQSDKNVAPAGIQCADNSFVDQGVSASYEPCGDRTIAFKQVFARKHWLGRPAYTARSYNMPNRLPWCCQCPETYPNLDVKNDGLHFLGVTATATYYSETTFAFTPEDNRSSTGTATAASVVNRFTGEYDVYTCGTSSFNSEDPEDQGPGATALGLLGMADGNITAVVSAFCDVVGDLSFHPPDDIEGSETTGWTLTYIDPFELQPFAVVSIGLGGSFSYDTYGYQIPYGGGPVGWYHLHHEELSFSQTGVHYYKIAWSQTAGLQGYSEWSMNGTLTHAYPLASARAELLNLVSQIPLGSDYLNWRTDGYFNAGPLVSYCENAFPVTIAISPGAKPSDLNNPTRYNGQIKGRLVTNPAGQNIHVNNVWNYYHNNYDQCDDGLCIAKYVNDYGAWSATSAFTPNATLWTDKRDWLHLPSNTLSFIGTGFFYTMGTSCNPIDARVNDNVLWAKKSAEIVIPKNSFNYYEPCGLTRLSVEPSSSRCVVTASLSTVTIEDYNSETSPFSNGAVCLIRGVAPHIDGIWRVSTASDYVVNLTTRYVSGSALPDREYEPTTTGFIGQLKWPFGYPICGRVDLVTIDNVTNPGGLITASFDSEYPFVIGDRIQVSGSRFSGSKVTIDNVVFSVANVIDPMNVVLNATIPTSSLYLSSSAQAFSAFAPDWKWSDSGSKHEFVISKYKMNYRPNGEYDRLQQQWSSSVSNTTCDWWFPPDYTGSYCAGTTTIPRPQNYCYDENKGCDTSIESVTHEMGCIPYSPCGPMVVYSSPVPETELETKYNCFNAGFTETDFDDVYGSMATTVLRQYWPDPSWVPLDCPCELTNKAEDPEVDDPIPVYECDCQWIPGCSPDQEKVEIDGIELLPCIKYYPEARYVEARTDIPAGAPGLFRPQIRMLTNDDMARGFTTSHGVYLGAPFNNSHYFYTNFVPSVYLTPYFWIYQAQRGCCGSRFDAIYARRQLDC